MVSNPELQLKEIFQNISIDDKIHVTNIIFDKNEPWLATRTKSIYQINPKNDLSEILNRIIPRRTDHFKLGRVGPELFSNTTLLEISSIEINFDQLNELDRLDELTDFGRNSSYILYNVSFMVLDTSETGQWLNMVYGSSNKYKYNEGIPETILKELLLLLKNTNSTISLHPSMNESLQITDDKFNEIITNRGFFGSIIDKLFG